MITAASASYMKYAWTSKMFFILPQNKAFEHSYELFYALFFSVALGAIFSRKKELRLEKGYNRPAVLQR